MLTFSGKSDNGGTFFNNLIKEWILDIRIGISDYFAAKWYNGIGEGGCGWEGAHGSSENQSC